MRDYSKNTLHVASQSPRGVCRPGFYVLKTSSGSRGATVVDAEARNTSRTSSLRLENSPVIYINSGTSAVLNE
jgi:hypothetical protein